MRKHDGVLFVHWLGDPQTSNATEFASDAQALASRGITSLCVNEPWSQPGWFTKIRTPDTDYAMSLDIVANLRAALGELARRPGVDAHRLAIVGHDFGGMYSLLAGASDERVKTFVIIAAVPTLSEWFALDKRRPDNQADYDKNMARLDPVAALAGAHADAFLFQFAQNDHYVPRDRATVLFNGAKAPRTMMIYPATHAMRTPEIFNDRLWWLVNHLR